MYKAGPHTTITSPTHLAYRTVMEVKAVLVLTLLVIAPVTPRANTLSDVAIRANETLQGLFYYYWAHDPDAKKIGFFFACGQIGGMGNPNEWRQCVCYSRTACVNCYRWWDAVALESIANYGIYTKTKQYANIPDVVFAHSPYNANWDASISCTFVDDFSWYGIAYLRVYDWLQVYTITLYFIFFCLIVFFPPSNRILSGLIDLLQSTTGPGSMVGMMTVVGSGGILVAISSSRTQSQLWRFCTLDPSWHTCFQMRHCTWRELKRSGTGFSVSTVGMV